MRVVTIVGARPQFIKCAPVSRLLRRSATEVLVHTGQHYDENMSATFFADLQIPEPDYNLGVGSATHGVQTAEMLSGIEKVLLAEKPDLILVYGDTNSTLAGALAASKLLIPVAHVEAGLRSFRMAMPEEQNRVIADRLSTLLFCPTTTAVDNLAAEGIRDGVHLVGDVMYDALLYNAVIAARRPALLHELGLAPKQYILATIHRAESTDESDVLKRFLHAFAALCDRGYTILLPLHPRTRSRLESSKLTIDPRVTVVEPLGYLDMLGAEQNARIILTDSGGVQKEAFWFHVPCVTLREETEWVETVRSGWNVLAGSNVAAILEACERPIPRKAPERASLEDGHAAERIVQMLLSRRCDPAMVQSATS